MRTALFWGAGWGAAAVVVMGAMRLVGEIPADIGLLDIVGMAVRVAVWGGIVGTLFSGVIGLAFRGRRVSDLRVSRFAALGAVVGGVGIPALLTLFNWIGGEPRVPWALLQDDAILGTVFGGVLAGGSLWLAQRAARRDGDAAVALARDTARDTAPDALGAGATVATADASRADASHAPASRTAAAPASTPSAAASHATQ